MSSFTSPLHVTPMPDGRRWKLTRSFQYRLGSKYSKHYISVPRGFETDFASIPKFLWFLPLWATYCKAPVLHDWLYQHHITTRKRADEIFYEAMLVDWRNRKARWLMAKVEFWAVRLFGWIAFRKGSKT